MKVCALVSCWTTRWLTPHVCRLAGRCFYHLRGWLRTMRRSLTDDAAKTMVHSFIINRIDYCISVLYGMPVTPAVHKRPQQMPSTQLREWYWRCLSFNTSLQLSAISSTGCLWNNLCSLSRHYSYTISSSSGSFIVLYRHVSVSASVSKFHARHAIFARPLMEISLGYDPRQQDTESEVFLRLPP